MVKPLSVVADCNLAAWSQFFQGRSGRICRRGLGYGILFGLWESRRYCTISTISSVMRHRGLWTEHPIHFITCHSRAWTWVQRIFAYFLWPIGQFEPQNEPIWVLVTPNFRSWTWTHKVHERHTSHPVNLRSKWYSKSCYWVGKLENGDGRTRTLRSMQQYCSQDRRLLPTAMLPVCMRSVSTSWYDAMSVTTGTLQSWMILPHRED